jgi:hypothetical protein
VERVLTLSAQGWLWTAGYVFFLFIGAACALVFFFRQRRAQPEPVDAKASRAKKKRAESQPTVLWLALAACSCIMLLATTNLLCQQIAPAPLLWVVPLSLYLLSFIVCFDHARWYRREIFCPLYLVLALLALKLLPSYSEISTATLLVIFCSALLAVCMTCHGELARLKPAADHLTSFYLAVSAGGALGSAIVVVVAPQLFDRFWEFQLGLVGCGVLLAINLVRDKSSWFYTLGAGVILLLVGVTTLLIGAIYFTNDLLEFEGQGDIVISRTRNFFGIKSVLLEEGQTVLVHGHTLHGLQYLDPGKRNEPSAYYARESGIGLLLDQYQRTSDHALNIGVIGMGAGTLASYGRTSDSFRFYEIDPSIPEFSLGPHPVFTFVQASPAHVDVVIGDARVEMQEEASRGRGQRFDVLVVDAFSGDSIPVHLLTREAMDLYLRQLREPESVLAFHVSGTVLDLRPVLKSFADFYQLASVEVDGPSPYNPTWILLSRQPRMFSIPTLAAKAYPLEASKSIHLWTDDHSSLYDLFRW